MLNTVISLMLHVYGLHTPVSGLTRIGSDGVRTMICLHNQW